jgi:hypothetical protein
MPVIAQRVTIAGSSVNDNVLAGSQFEYLPYNAELEFGINGDANAVDLRVDVYSGQDILMENGMINSQARFPVYPDDFTLTDVAAAGERLKIRIRNLNAAGRDAFISVRITPIG